LLEGTSQSQANVPAEIAQLAEQLAKEIVSQLSDEYVKQISQLSMKLALAEARLAEHSSLLRAADAANADQKELAEILLRMSHAQIREYGLESLKRVSK
jgi:hypothetical protein